MFMLIQKIYINILAALYEKCIVKISKEARKAYVLCCFIGIFIFFILAFSGEFLGRILYTNTQRQIIIGGLLVVSSIFSIEGKLSPVKWNKLISVPLFLGAIGLIVTGLMHPIGNGYLNFGLMILTIYPVFYIVWNNRKDYVILFDQLSRAAILVNGLYVL